jgi:uncharacterized protein (TIGR03437 family)
MNSTSRRAARFRCLFLFALVAFPGVSLAQVASPSITFLPATLDFKYTTGNALPAAQTVQIKSTGAALNFTIPAVAAEWLSVSANSGTTTASVKVYVNPTSMASGSYAGSIVVDAPLAATPSVTFTVTMEIADPPPVLSASPASLTFLYTTSDAGPPAAQPVAITSTDGAASTTVSVTGGAWLSATPTSILAIAGIPGTESVSVNPAGLAPATYSGTVKFTPSIAGSTPLTVTVTLTVAAGVPVITNLWPPGGLIGSPNMIVTVTGQNFMANSTVSIGAVKLPAPNVLTSTTMLLTMPAAEMLAAGTLPITITTPTAASPSATTLASTFQVYFPGPQVLAVTDAASYALGNLSPGEMVTIYGLGLGPAVGVSLTVSDPLATSLPAGGAAATSVTIDGKPAPLLYASENQVSCIVPFNVTTGGQVNLSVTYNSIASASPTKVNAVAANPGLFTMNYSGSGQGAILNFNPATGDYTLNGPANLAIKGTTWAVLYLTGFGLTSCVDIPANGATPASACNAAATEVNLINGDVSPNLAVSVTIGGIPAPGAAVEAPIGSVPGLMQVNVLVPAGVASGNVPVVVSVGPNGAQVSSQTSVTMDVK